MSHGPSSKARRVLGALLEPISRSTRGYFFMLGSFKVEVQQWLVDYVSTGLGKFQMLVVDH
jgi:hypothetical protein